MTCGDIDEAAVRETAAGIVAAGGRAQALKADVTRLEELVALVGASVMAFGSVDVMVNNAGIMPLAFSSDHAAAHAARGPLHRHQHQGRAERHGGRLRSDDRRGARPDRQHLLDLRNFPVVGAAVYGASKAAMNVLSESFRMETRGKIKVTTVKPTGVPATGLADAVVNPAAVVGIVGHLPALHELQRARCDPWAAEGHVEALAGREQVFRANRLGSLNGL